MALILLLIIFIVLFQKTNDISKSNKNKPNKNNTQKSNSRFSYNIYNEGFDEDIIIDENGNEHIVDVYGYCEDCDDYFEE